MDESSKGKEALNANFQTASNGNNLRGEALQATLEKEEILRMMINNSHVVFFLWKNENKWPVEFVSENVTKFGYTTEDFTSGRVRHKDIIYSADLKRVEQEFEKRVKSGVSAFGMEYRIVTKAGDVRECSSATPFTAWLPCRQRCAMRTALSGPSSMMLRLRILLMSPG